jgi:hypothetical protein
MEGQATTPLAYALWSFNVDMAFPIAFTIDHERTGPSQSLNFKCAKSRAKGRSPSHPTGITSAWSHHVESVRPSSGKTAEKNHVMVVRQHPRFQATFSGTLVHQSHLHQIDKSLDLSRKGCRLESSFRAFAGMKVDLLLYIHEDKTPILIQGAVVRWSGAHGIGIQFQSLVSPHQEQLARILRQLEATAGHS